MMVPPGTNCPPNAFTPSRCALESRPFRELPNPFLCAISVPSPQFTVHSLSVAMETSLTAHYRCPSSAPFAYVGFDYLPRFSGFFLLPVSFFADLVPLLPADFLPV